VVLRSRARPLLAASRVRFCTAAATERELARALSRALSLALILSLALALASST
jgi:hypothetical protein